MVSKNYSKNQNILKSELMLPLIVTDFDEIVKLVQSNFYGIYYKDANRPDWDKKIIIVYENIVPNSVKAICEKSDYYFGAYTETVEGKTYKIISFTVPQNFKKELDNILNGDYEKTTMPIRNKILDFWSFSPITKQKLEEHFLGWEANWKKTKIKTENLILTLNQTQL
jgi:hypothetical protein